MRDKPFNVSTLLSFVLSWFLVCIESDRGRLWCRWRIWLLHASDSCIYRSRNHLIEFYLGKGDVGHDGKRNHNRLTCDDWGGCDSSNKCNICRMLISCRNNESTFVYCCRMGKSVWTGLSFTVLNSSLSVWSFKKMSVYLILGVKVVFVCDARHFGNDLETIYWFPHESPLIQPLVTIR